MSEAESQPADVVELGLGEGAEAYTLHPQPYPRLFRQLSEFGNELQELGEMKTEDLQSVVLALGGRVHEFLRIFIPNLMSEHRFAGFATREQFEQGEVDEAAEASAPTIPQVRHAVETAFRVNGLADLGGLLGKLMGPAMKGSVQKLLAAEMSKRLSQGSKTSPATSGDQSRTEPPSDASGDAGPTAGERSSAPPSPALSASRSLASTPS